MENNQNSRDWNIPASPKAAKKTFRHRPIISAIIAAVCIVIYLSAVIQATVRLYLSIDKSKIVAEKEFSQIADIALSAGTNGFMEQRFRDVMNSALTTSSRIEALIISDPAGEYVFEKQRGYIVKWVSNSPRFINRFGFSNQEYYMPLPIQNVSGASIRAAVSSYDYNAFTNILKQTLLIIMVGFAISFFTMLIQLLAGKQEPETYNRAPYEPANDDMIDSESGPKGLYSPHSSIGWEEYINDRLNSELQRCSSTEKDLTFLLIDFSASVNDETYRQSAKEAIASLTPRDMLFEYGKRGIAAILPGISLETGITKSEKYHRHIMERFPGTGINIGLTSRSGRLLNAGRIILEATEALKKAKKDPSTSIIAFKSDPEKYREFIRKRS